MSIFLGILIGSGAPAAFAAGNKSALVPILKPTDPTAAAQRVADGALRTEEKGAPQALPAVSLTRTTVTLKSGDSLLSALVAGGVPRAEAYRDLAKLKAINPHRLLPGDRFTFAFIGSGTHKKLASVTWTGKRGGNTSVALLPEAPTPGNDTAPLVADARMTLKTMVLHGTPALPRTLTESGLPPQVCEQVIMALQQTRRPPVHGEMVKIVYQVPVNPAAGPAPQLRYTSYTGRDGKQRIYPYAALATPPSLQHVDLTPATEVTLLEPLPGARISSPFGWRIHPVLHSRRFHKGVDYEAALGTPVIAAADGVVEDFGRRGTYGNYIRLRHSDRLETAYAHLAGFSPALSVGGPVHRGDVIGYVGMTGVATGPHLYYELLIDGRQIDPEGTALRNAIRQQVPQTASVLLP